MHLRKGTMSAFLCMHPLLRVQIPAVTSHLILSGIVLKSTGFGPPDEGLSLPLASSVALGKSWHFFALQCSHL